MAKFCVFYNDNPIHTATFESGVVHIGRDESNDLNIDSLAFAPAHAAVILHDTENIIKQLNADFPLLINGVRHSKHNLQDGDIITIGKHRIVFNPAETKTTFPGSKSSAAIQASVKQGMFPEANLQIMAGKHIGHVVSLKKNMTRIGHKEVGILVITRRKEGYFASLLEPNDNIKINNSGLTDTAVLLQNNDIIFINHIPMQFIWTVKS
ncbi:hypothetical protein BJAS_P3848 [Bathymodiolus japonicus methanotrophic gill symbiont]|uniref:FHA domain-containing protein n=1 Tax=Bathymodiolus japonicus methanotrophic gill symbiont TaxID=113269 RepID=UPI001B507104|nr:FHA domain-containing protein [Bathymodiolus japonicus methanotrophic gill symbiont]GFO73185.1 hypothetical protein BJAS_P3848 [Bathymodiolus japonicus methanotrophic gill symbiont]